MSFKVEKCVEIKAPEGARSPSELSEAPCGDEGSHILMVAVFAVRPLSTRADVNVPKSSLQTGGRR